MELLKRSIVQCCEHSHSWARRNLSSYTEKFFMGQIIVDLYQCSNKKRRFGTWQVRSWRRFQPFAFVVRSSTPSHLSVKKLSYCTFHDMAMAFVPQNTMDKFTSSSPLGHKNQIVNRYSASDPIRASMSELGWKIQ
jgi:hypothetical protein